MPRLSRIERQEQTRRELIEAARRVFLRTGFHQASLSEIADDAGYSTGAVYSNFEGKDELFLAVFDARYEERKTIHAARVLGAESLHESAREAAREIAGAYRREPGWTVLVVEFWTHAARRPELFAEVEKRHDHLLGDIAALLDEIAARYGVVFILPTREVARGGNALSRGMALESLASTDADQTEVFEEMLSAYLLGLTRPSNRPYRPGNTNPREGSPS